MCFFGRGVDQFLLLHPSPLIVFSVVGLINGDYSALCVLKDVFQLFAWRQLIVEVLKLANCVAQDGIVKIFHNGFHLVEFLAEREAMFAHKARIMMAVIRRNGFSLANLEC